MTIIIGIKAKDAIVFASDSQTTTLGSEGFRKVLNAKKIHLLTMKHDKVIVAESGDATYSSRAVELLTEMVRDQEISDYRTVATMAEDAIKEVRKKIVSLFDGSSPESIQDYIHRNCYFGLTIGYYYRMEPLLFFADNYHNSANLIRNHFVVSGCVDVAEHLMKEYCEPDQYPSIAFVNALYVVEKVKLESAVCGGFPQAVIVFSRGDELWPNIDNTDGRIIDPEEIKPVLSEMAVLETDFKQKRRLEILTMLDRLAREADLKGMEGSGEKPQ